MKKFKIILIVLTTVMSLTLQPYKAAIIKFDFNADELITDQDAVYLLMYTFFPESYPIEGNCDVNNDGEINDADAIYLLMSTFFPEDYPLSQNIIIGEETYEPVEYIEANGTNYIDTGISSNNFISGELIYSELPEYGTLFGCMGSKYNLEINDSTYTYNANPSLQITNTIENSEIYTIKFDSSSISINEIIGTNNVSSNLNCQGNFRLFYGNGNYGTGKLVSGKIYSNGTLVRDYIAVKRLSDNAYGLVDTIHNKFYKLQITNEQTDAYFFNDNTVFNADLAMYLLNLQMNAYNSSYSNLLSDDEVDDYALADGYLLLSKWRNETSPLTENSSAYNLYYKQVESNGKSYNLYILNILSTQNEVDMKSNLDIGDSSLHAGCEKTADFVINNAINLLIDNNAENNKIIITGNARGAAVGAIIAEKLTDSEKFSKSNVYAYVFGCPNYSTDTEKEKLSNVFMINNPSDPLCILPLEEWGYTNNGTTIILSAEEPIFTKMKENYINNQIIENNKNATAETYDNTLYEEFAGVTDFEELKTYILATFPDDSFLKDQNNINFVLNIINVAFNNPQSLDVTSLLAQVTRLSSNPRAMRELIFYLTDNPARFAYGKSLDVYKAWLQAQYNID